MYKANKRIVLYKSPRQCCRIGPQVPSLRPCGVLFMPYDAAFALMYSSRAFCGDGGSSGVGVFAHSRTPHQSTLGPPSIPALLVPAVHVFPWQQQRLLLVVPVASLQPTFFV